MRKFIINFFIYEMILVIVYSLINAALFYSDKYLPIYPFTTLLFGVITGLIFYVIVYFGEKNNANVVNSFMITSGIQFVLYLSLFTIYIYAVKPDNLLWVTAVFMSHYFGFTFFGIVYLVKYLKKKENNSN